MPRISTKTMTLRYLLALVLLALFTVASHSIFQESIIVRESSATVVRANEPLRGLLAASAPEIRQAVVQALGRLQATEAKEGIRALLEDPDYWVGFRAGEALAGMGEVGRESLQRACASAHIGGSTMARYFLERT